MLNSRQRAQLRGMANGYETILHIGKSDIGEEIIKQADNALKARELIKCCVLETSSLSSREAADIVAAKTGADVVQVIGSRFILYRENKDNKKIFLRR
ncbi:MAG: YhbY family RNA-binding protein [Clostridia bacterium]|nr:YhbY family RNA-binding protein [Clostridia bacterium]